MKRIIVFILFFIAGKSSAQNTAQKIENTGKQLETAVENLGRLKDLFGKKDQKKSGGSVAQSGSSKAMTASLAPNTISIDASQIYPFINGKAIVKKGEAYGVIDTAGRFIVPYNKYNTIAYGGTNSLIASNETNSIMLNNKGGLIVDFKTIKGNWKTTGSDFVFVRPNNARSFNLIDGNGKSYTITENALPNGKYLEFHRITEQAVILKNPVTNKYGFKGLNNQLLADAVFIALSDFKNGFATYGQLDNLGTLKHGIIDIKGQKTVPPTFSNMPINLGGGYFQVSAAADADFLYAIVNSKGDIIFKQAKDKQPVYDFSYYEDGYFFNSQSSHIMDSAGKIMAAKDVLMKAGLGAKNSEFARFITYRDEDFLGFNSASVRSADGFLGFEYVQADNMSSFGLLNLKTNQVILGPFSENAELSYKYMFDPASRLAMVIQDTKVQDKNKGYGTLQNIGYITTDGKFKIVQAEKKSGW